MNEAAAPISEPVYIERLVYGGDGMGRLADGRAVFVPFVLPGETVQVQVVAEKRGHVRAVLNAVQPPSTERLAPPCPHFGICGGCHYQHIPYARQLEIKTEIVRDQLQRLGGLSDIPLRPAVASPQPFYYRNYVQFHLTPGGKLGFQAARSNDIVEISECRLAVPAIGQLWPLLDLEPVLGLERVGLRAGSEYPPASDEEEAPADLQIIFESGEVDGELEPLDFTVEELPVSAVHIGPGGALLLAGSPDVGMTVLGRDFRVSAASFFQVNLAQAANLVQHLLDGLTLGPQTTLLEVYCGVGLFAAFLAPRVGKLIGIEVSAAACEDFSANLDEFDNVELYEAPAEEVLMALNFKPDVILVDPPRAGLGQRTLDGLLRQDAAVIAYISCDPSTLARDARRLTAAGYRLEQITPFDMFPQTYHIETLSFWRKA